MCGGGLFSFKVLFWGCLQCSPTAPSQLQQMGPQGPICCNWLGAVGEHWRQPQKSTLKEKSSLTHTQLWQLLSNFLLKLLSAQDVNFLFVQHFHFFRGVNFWLIIFGARKLFFEDVKLSLNFLFNYDYWKIMILRLGKVHFWTWKQKDVKCDSNFLSFSFKVNYLMHIPSAIHVLFLIFSFQNFLPSITSWSPRVVG